MKQPHLGSTKNPIEYRKLPKKRDKKKQELRCNETTTADCESKFLPTSLRAQDVAQGARHGFADLFFGIGDEDEGDDNAEAH